MHMPATRRAIAILRGRQFTVGVKFRLEFENRYSECDGIGQTGICSQKIVRVALLRLVLASKNVNVAPRAESANSLRHSRFATFRKSAAFAAFPQLRKTCKGSEKIASAPEQE
jgi:hypothetical protein